MKIILLPTVLLLTLFAAVAIFIVRNSNDKLEAIGKHTNAAEMQIQKTLVSSEKRKPVIVELFTSEGCSSCPNADNNLSMLEREQPVANAEIVVLSEHVDYWNRLGWKDPFSSSQFSNRQGEYSQFLGKNGDVYTPQMIVDGIRELPGHDMRAALKAVTEVAGEAKGEVSIKINQFSGERLALDVEIKNLPQISINDNAIVLLVITQNNLASSITRGENAGRRLTHTGVVRYMQNIGSVVNEDKTLPAVVTLGKDWNSHDLKVIAFVQETGSRRILGANKFNLINAFFKK